MSFSRVYFLVDWIERQYWYLSPLISVCYIDKRMHFFAREKWLSPSLILVANSKIELGTSSMENQNHT